MSYDEKTKWCHVDDCPAVICGGPHVSHKCQDGSVTVTSHVDNRDPCPFCGLAPGNAQPEEVAEGVVPSNVLSSGSPASSVAAGGGSSYRYTLACTRCHSGWEVDAQTEFSLLPPCPDCGRPSECRGVYRVGEVESKCELCGHRPACGYARVHLPDGASIRLCHKDSHSCYHRWTVYGDRPTTWMGVKAILKGAARP